MDPNELDKAYNDAMAGSDEPDYMEFTIGYLRLACTIAPDAWLTPDVAKFLDDHKDLPEDTWVGLTKNSISLLDI